MYHLLNALFHSDSWLYYMGYNITSVNSFYLLHHQQRYLIVALVGFFYLKKKNKLGAVVICVEGSCRERSVGWLVVDCSSQVQSTFLNSRCTVSHTIHRFIYNNNNAYNSWLLSKRIENKNKNNNINYLYKIQNNNQQWESHWKTKKWNSNNVTVHEKKRRRTSIPTTELPPK